MEDFIAFQVAQMVANRSSQSPYRHGNRNSSTIGTISTILWGPYEMTSVGSGGARNRFLNPKQRHLKYDAHQMYRNISYIFEGRKIIMQVADVRYREILGLKTRAVAVIVENYTTLFDNREELLDLIPKTLRQEIFNRLINRGILSNKLFSKVNDKRTTLLDLKSARGGFDSNSCLVLKNFENLQVLFLTQIVSSPESLSTMFSKLYRLKTLEITNSPTFDDSVLKCVAENCACLKVLNVSRTSIGDEGLCSLATFSISLMALDISYSNVSFPGIEKLISSPSGQTLKELKCTNTKIAGRQEILSSILGFRNLEDYSFTFNSNEEADWVLGRVTAKLKNFAFNIPF